VAETTTGFPPLVTSDARSGSPAILMLYLAAPGTGSQRKTSGSSGKVIVAPSSGDVSAGVSAQSFSIDRGADQGEVLPLESTAWTRQ